LPYIRRISQPRSPLLRGLGERAFEAIRSSPPPSYEESLAQPRNEGEDATQQSGVDIDDSSSSSSGTSEHVEDINQQSRGVTGVSEVGLDGPNDSNRPAKTDVLDEFGDEDILRDFAELLTGSEVDERHTPPFTVIGRLNATGAQHWDPLQDDDEEDDENLYV
jgi:hypothetical protein